MVSAAVVMLQVLDGFVGEDLTCGQQTNKQSSSADILNTMYLWLALCIITMHWWAQQQRPGFDAGSTGLDGGTNSLNRCMFR